MNIRNSSKSNIRADNLLANANNSYSRSALSKLFEMGNITSIENNPLKPGDKVRPGEEIVADITPIQKPADDIELPILFEDDDVIVIDKPVGVISHARGRYWDEASVASFVRTRITDIEGERAGIVHRLDRATSGVMICAKNSETLSYLQKQFNNRSVKKHYKAIVEGNMSPLSGIIDIPIARNPKDPKKFFTSVDGKEAQTEYHTEGTNSKYTILDLHPYTGRTHQLRVHLRHVSHPIVGDQLYNGQVSDRLMLHAFSLEITIPGGVRRVFSSKLPAEFNDMLNDA